MVVILCIQTVTEAVILQGINMNLIEQLGGYEKAKSKSRDNGSLHSERLKKALLEYRRQHNIFEVGDKVVLKNSRFGSHNDAIYTVVNINKSHMLYELCIGWCGFSHYLEHATPEEIKAGRRL